MDFPKLVKSDKTLLFRPEWRVEDENRFGFVTPLDVQGVTVEGLQLRANALREIPERNVVFQLELHQSGHRAIALSRICWNPLTAHNNKKKGPKEFRNKLIFGSHSHEFDLNFLADQGTMRSGNLKVALPLSNEPADYHEILESVGKTFRINNIELVGRPPWQERLF